MDISVRNLLKYTQKKFLSATDTPSLDAEILVCYGLKKTREWIYANPDALIASKKLEKIQRLIKRRMASEPVAYIVGEKEFYGLPFIVNRNTLIPRPETELLVDLTCEKITAIRKNHDSRVCVVDVGTGSGCIVISVAKSLRQEKKVSFIGIDASAAALNTAAQNCRKSKVSSKIKLMRSDLLKQAAARISALKIRHLHIVANLPYVSTSEYYALSPSVKAYEPKEALIAQDSGLELIKKLILESIDLYQQNQRLTLSACLEIGPHQKKSLEAFLKRIPQVFSFTFHRDLAGKWRVLQLDTALAR